LILDPSELEARLVTDLDSVGHTDFQNHCLVIHDKNTIHKLV
jgi:hypothetical protein